MNSEDSHDVDAVVMFAKLGKIVHQILVSRQIFSLYINSKSQYVEFTIMP